MSECEDVPEQLEAAERDNQNPEDQVRSLKTDVEASKRRQCHLKVEPKSFLEVLGGKVDDLRDLRRASPSWGPTARSRVSPQGVCDPQQCQDVLPFAWLLSMQARPVVFPNQGCHAPSPLQNRDPPSLLLWPRGSWKTGRF